jgi:hypothetical protein
MTGYADIFYLIGAIVVFSLLSLQVNRMMVRNDIIQMESTIEYHVAAHAQDYADLIQLIETEDDLENFLNNFPRVDSVSFDENNSSAMLEYQVNIEASDTTLPNSNVTNKAIHISLNNEYLSANKPSKAIRLKLIKSFSE